MAFALVKNTGIGTNTASPTTFTFTGGNTAGNMIVVATFAFPSGSVNPITGITDTIGNTPYTLAASLNAGINEGGTISYYFVNPCLGTGANNTVSVAWTVGTQTRLTAIAMEYSGGTGATVDTSNGIGVTGATVSYNITATAAGDLIVNSFGHSGGGVTWSALSAGAVTITGLGPSQTEVDNIVAGANGVNAITATSSATFCGGGSVAFKLGATGGGGTGWVNRHRRFVNKR